MPKEKTNTERINVFFTPEVIKSLKIIATNKGTTVSGLVRMIVLEYLFNKK